MRECCIIFSSCCVSKISKDPTNCREHDRTLGTKTEPIPLARHSHQQTVLHHRGADAVPVPAQLRLHGPHDKASASIRRALVFTRSPVTRSRKCTLFDKLRQRVVGTCPHRVPPRVSKAPLGRLQRCTRRSVRSHSKNDHVLQQSCPREARCLMVRPAMGFGLVAHSRGYRTVDALGARGHDTTGLSVWRSTRTRSRSYSTLIALGLICCRWKLR